MDGNGDQRNAEDGRLSGECGEVTPDEMAHLPQACSSRINCTEQPDSEDTNCIPDTQFVQSAHRLPSDAVSPDVEMIPDTPDSASSAGVRKTFQRSYLASTSNLLAACDIYPGKNMSPPRRKMAKGKCPVRKNTAKNPEECTDLTIPNGASLQSNCSPSILHSVAAAHLPYPSCDVLHKRCATDPFPLSKRSDHKVTPTKPVPSTNSDVVYGTVPSRLFQESLNREKHRQFSNSRTNKENSKPVEEMCKSSDVDSDPVLLEVLGELKVDSPRSECVQNDEIAFNPQATNSSISDGVSSFCDKTADKRLETPYTYDDLEDILGELRQHSGIQHSVRNTRLNDVEKNPSSLSSNDVRESPSSLSDSKPVSSTSLNVLDDRNLALLDDSVTQWEVPVPDFKPTELNSEEQMDNSARNLAEEHTESECYDVAEADGRLVNGVSVSHPQSDSIGDNVVDKEMFSANCDQEARFVLDCYCQCQLCRSASIGRLFVCSITQNRKIPNCSNLV